MSSLGLPHWLSSKESACNEGEAGSNPGSWRSLQEGKGSPLQYSCLRNHKDRGAWCAIVHGVARVRHDWATNQQLCLLPPHENEKAGDQSSAPTRVVQGEDKEWTHCVLGNSFNDKDGSGGKSGHGTELWKISTVQKEKIKNFPWKKRRMNSLCSSRN